jgi:hypothetical protein
MIAGVGTVWKLAPFEISATQAESSVPCELEDLLDCSHDDFLQRFATCGRALVTDDVRTCLAASCSAMRKPGGAWTKRWSPQAP